MHDRSTEHATFTIERVYPALPNRVYQAWTNPEIKARWYGPSDQKIALTLDYRIGGREHFTGVVSNGMVFGYEAIFHEIVPDTRIVYSYTMDFDQVRISASLVTVEITATGTDNARLMFTEQGVYLDGADTPAARKLGTANMLEALTTELSD